MEKLQMIDKICFVVLLFLSYICLRLLTNDCWSRSTGNDWINVSLMIAGLARNCDLSIEYLLEDIRNVACAVRKSSLYILESNSQSNNTKIVISRWMSEQHNRKCKQKNAAAFSFTILRKGKPANYNGRIQRIAKLRNQVLHALRSSPRHDVTLILDFDLSHFSPHAEILSSIQLVAAGKWHAMCSNGRQGSLHGKYYDTFATILVDGTFPYYRDNTNPIENQHLRFHRTVYPWEDKKFLIDGPEGFSQDNLTDYVGKHVALPVISCFGGATLYQSYFLLDVDPKCDYSWSRGGKWPQRFFNAYDASECEHVSLHSCLSKYDGSNKSFRNFKIAISSRMKTVWHAVFQG